MKLTLDMENLGNLVEEAIKENLNNVIEQEVHNVIAQKVNTSAKEIIDNIVNEKLTSYVNEYIKTATVSVGGGWNSRALSCGFICATAKLLILLMFILNSC